MTRAIINENQRGIAFKNGKFTDFLMPGKYFYLGSTEVEVLPVDEAVTLEHCTAETLLSNEKAAKNLHTLNVPDGCVALHYKNGNFAEILKSGTYIFITVGVHHFKLIDTSKPELPDEALKVIDKIPSEFYSEYVVRDAQRGRLTFDGRFVKLLEPGRYLFWNGAKSVDCDIINVNIEQYSVAGQELLTSDKITLRVSFVFNCRVVDVVRIV